MKKFFVMVLFVVLCSMVSAEQLVGVGTPYGITPDAAGQLYVNSYMVPLYRAKSTTKGDFEKVIGVELKASTEFVASSTTAVMPLSEIVTISAGSASDIASFPVGLEGQQVTLIMTECVASGSCAISSEDLNGGDTLTFDAVGENAVLVFIDEVWYMLSGTATLSTDE